jgi:hypothetical protein
LAAASWFEPGSVGFDISFHASTASLKRATASFQLSFGISSWFRGQRLRLGSLCLVDFSLRQLASAFLWRQRLVSLEQASASAFALASATGFSNGFSISSLCHPAASFRSAASASAFALASMAGWQNSGFESGARSCFCV